MRNAAKASSRDRHARRIGFVFWLFVLTCVTVWLRPGTESHSPATNIASYLTTRHQTYRLNSPGVPLIQGDPIFAHDASGQWLQIGHVESLQAEAGGERQSLLIRCYQRGQANRYQYTYCKNDGSLAEAASILLPPDRREAILKRLSDVQEQHGTEIVDAFKPIIEQTLIDSAPVIKQGLLDAIASHREDLQQIGHRYEEELLNERIIPLVRSEILPVVQLHGQPVAEEIGLELWDRASLFRFGWRMVYDKSPLPSRNLTNKEWDRFVENEAVPVFESHMDDVIVALKKTLGDVAQNEAIRDEMSDVIENIARDPELQRLLGAMTKEGIVDNAQLREVWRKNWQSPQAQRALQLANSRLEPVVREIGDEIFGTREQGIRPGFARVLRNQILGKDRRWIEATLVADGAAEQPLDTLAVAHDTRPYPLMFLAGGNPIPDSL